MAPDGYVGVQFSKANATRTELVVQITWNRSALSPTVLVVGVHIKHTPTAQKKPMCSGAAGYIDFERKDPNALCQWVWQYVLPSIALSKDPRSKKIIRHHYL
jgi:hypothetical protein